MLLNNKHLGGQGFFQWGGIARRMKLIINRSDIAARSVVPISVRCCAHVLYSEIQDNVISFYTDRKSKTRP